MSNSENAPVTSVAKQLLSKETNMDVSEQRIAQTRPGLNIPLKLKSWAYATPMTPNGNGAFTKEPITSVEMDIAIGDPYLLHGVRMDLAKNFIQRK
jgi:hypothetical protein